MRISDWSSDVCSSDLSRGSSGRCRCRTRSRKRFSQSMPANRRPRQRPERRTFIGADTAMVRPLGFLRSEEHTSELQSLMRISYAVFCLKKKKQQHKNTIGAIQKQTELDKSS